MEEDWKRVSIAASDTRNFTASEWEPILPPPHLWSRPTCPLGCSDFHISSQSYQFSPIPAFLRTIVFRKYQKKRLSLLLFQPNFFDFFKNLYFFWTCQNQFSKSVLNQYLQNFQGIIFDKYYQRKKNWRIWEKSSQENKTS